MSKLSLLPPPPKWSKHMYIRIPRRDIAFFKFMLECEHNLAMMTVVDKYEADIQLIYAPGQTREVECFVKRMETEMAVHRIFLPGSHPNRDWFQFSAANPLQEKIPFGLRPVSGTQKD